jgi:hypothetical protein
VVRFGEVEAEREELGQSCRKWRQSGSCKAASIVARLRGEGSWRVVHCEGGGRAAALQRFLADYLVSFYKTSHSAEGRGMGQPSR